MQQKVFGLVFALLMLGASVFAQEEESCASDGLMYIGELGVVTEGEANNLRDSASTNGALLGQMAAGEQFRVLEGPVCAEGYIWWRVRYNGIEGWTAEGSDGEYWIRPIIDKMPIGNPYTSSNITVDNMIGVGANVVVRTSYRPSIEAREEPFVDAAIVNHYAANTILTVVGDVQENDGMRWWLTEDEAGNQGWMTEAMRRTDDSVELHLAPLCPYTENRLAFAAYDGGASVYSMSVNGGEICDLLFMRHYFIYGTIHKVLWSPDGSQLAIVADIIYSLVYLGDTARLEEGYGLFLVNADGSNLRRLLPDKFVSNVSWSPDGSQLAAVAFDTLASLNGDIWTVNADGTGASQLSSAGNLIYHLQWSPDGAQILYSSIVAETETTNVMLVSSSGGNPELLFSREEDRHLPVWSPDSQQIALGLAWTDDEGIQLALNLDSRDYVYANGQNIEGYRYQAPAYSPDGTRIAYWGSNARGYRLFVFGAATGQLLGDSGAELNYSVEPTNPIWSDDGRSLYFGAGGIRRFNLDSWQEECLCRGIGYIDIITAAGISMQ